MVGYLVYVTTVGRVTDFPMLAEDLTQPMPLDGSEEIHKSVVRESEVAAIRGFGPSCPQVASPLILESRRKANAAQASARPLPSGRGIGTFVYADSYEIPPDTPHQIRLKPFSLVHVGASKDDMAEKDEILTVHAEQAVIEFDRPIDVRDLSGLQPLAGWVQGDVTLKSNRRTVEPKDDIVMFTERLDYDRNKRLIWANETVKIVVENEGTITGKGLEIELYSEDEPEPAPGTRRAEARGMKLLRDARFELLVAQDEDFLGGAAPAKGDPEAQLERSMRDQAEVVVSSHGPFVYDLEKNVATFQKMVRVLRRHPGAAPGSADSVDQLEADTLTLQFERGEAPAEGNGAAPAGGDEELKVSKAIATGPQVILLSESRKLQASGNYLEFDAREKRVALRGEQEMIAVQDNAVIHARALHIEQDPGGEPRRIVAEGPSGWMELAEEGPKSPEKEEGVGRQLRVRWQKQLTLDRRPETDSYAFHITGGVELEHDKGALTCQQLRGLLVPVETAPPDATGKAQTRLEPIKMEAEGNVSFHSDRIDVVSETLLMDILSRRDPKPATEAPVEDRGVPVAKQEPPPIPEAPAEPPRKEKDPLASAQVQSESETSEPLSIQARTVAIVLERVGSESRPASAWAEGKVRVSQAPRKAGERPIEILGNQLEYQRRPDGDTMVVGGTEQTLAEIRSVDMTVSAQRKILLNEQANKMDINGPGFLIFETGNTLAGEKSDKPVPVRVDWEDAMTFDGKNAFFEGKVVAKTTTAASAAEIQSSTLEVTLDRKLDFRHSRAGSAEPAQAKPAIESIFCEGNVEAFDRELQGGAPVRAARIMADQLRYDHIEQAITIDGAGNVTIVEPNRPGKDRAGRVAPPELPFRVTIVSFADRMAADKASDTVKFFGGVEIVHTPVADPSAAVDPDKLPEDGLTISSRRAEMAQGVDPSGKKYRLFNANEDVKVQARKYHATCGRVSYDEQKDVVVFEGEKGRPAYFHHQTRPGEPFQTMSARAIRFNRTTQEIVTDQSEGFQAIDVGAPARPGATRR